MALLHRPNDALSHFPIVNAVHGLVFLNMLSAYEVAKGKPEPDIFLKAAGKMGYEPANCIVIEDTIFGVRAGVAARMKVLNYQPVAAHRYDVPEGVVVFESMEQLPELIEQSSKYKVEAV